MKKKSKAKPRQYITRKEFSRQAQIPGIGETLLLSRREPMLYDVAFEFAKAATLVLDCLRQVKQYTSELEKMANRKLLRRYIGRNPRTRK